MASSGDEFEAAPCQGLQDRLSQLLVDMRTMVHAPGAQVAHIFQNSGSRRASGHGRYTRAMVFKSALIPRHVTVYHGSMCRAFLREFPGAPIGVKNCRRVRVLPGDTGKT